MKQYFMTAPTHRHPLEQRFPDPAHPFHVMFNPVCLEHDTGPHHPERPARLQSILHGCGTLPEQTPAHFHIPSPASSEQLLRVHDPAYLQALEETCRLGKKYFMSPDNPISAHSYAAILASGGLGIALGKQLAQGSAGFALTRPPGHHAGRARAEGFCFLNQIALAIETVRLSHPDAKFLVVDFDVHHGNGIQYLYDHDPSVFFYSIHGSPAHIYPGTGYESEIGVGDGKGFTRNITVDPGTGGDTWLKIFHKGLKEILSVYHPDFLLACAGFDAHEEDPYRFVHVTDNQFMDVIQTLEATAKTHCKNRFGLTLEGGYSTDVLGRLVPRCIEHLAKWRSGGLNEATYSIQK